MGRWRVQHRVGVADFARCDGSFTIMIGLQHVRANWLPHEISFVLAELLELLAFLASSRARRAVRERIFIAPFARFLCCNRRSGSSRRCRLECASAHAGVGLVNVLAARAAGAEVSTRKSAGLIVIGSVVDRGKRTPRR